MPVDTVFLRNTLEMCLEQRMEIQRLFDFLEEVLITPSQTNKYKAFKCKWLGVLPKPSQGMMLIRYHGTYLPSGLKYVDLEKQPCWRDFVREYDCSFNECTVDIQQSRHYQPLNFRELVGITFWKELYEEFGRKVVEYIFKKCAILYEVTEGLYLIVAYPSGPIHSKMSKFEPRRHFPAMIKAQQQPVHCGKLREYVANQNPYKLPEIKEDLKEIPVESESLCALPNQAGPSDPDTRLQDKSLKRPADILLPEPTTKRSRIDVSDCHRWIAPKADVLQKLIHCRSAVQLSCNENVKEATANTEDTKSSIHFVCIQKDDVFKPKDKSFILKQKCSMRVNKPKVPKNWEGLRLPSNLNSLADSEGTVQINVYIISESKAKFLGIRIKPKGRQKKQKAYHQHRAENSTIPKSNALERNKKSATPTKTGSPNVLLETRGNIISNLPQHIKVKSNPKKENSREPILPISLSIKPYSLLYTLPVAYCLYNKSFWSKWPVSHCLSKAVLLNNQCNKNGSIRLIVDDILKFETCSKDGENYLRNVFSKNWNAGNDSIPFNAIILNIVTTHSKFKHLHKLMKSCVSHWREKYMKKQSLKLKSMLPICSVTNPKDNATAKNMKIQGADQSCDKSGNLLEVIDITDDTDDSNVSTNYSFGSNSKGRDVTDCALPTTTTSSPKFEINVGSKVKKSKNCKKFGIFPVRDDKSFKNPTFKGLHPIPYNSVMQALKQVWHITKVDQLLGSKRNIRGFFTFVRKSIILGGIKSKLHLSQLMALIHVEDIPISQITKCKLAAELFTAKLVTWLFNEYLLVLLKTSFYVTERNDSRNQVNFYLRETWISATSRMKTSLLKKGALERLTESFNKGQPMQNAILRFIPKRNLSMRTLVSTKNSQSITREEGVEINKYLHYIDIKINKSRLFLPTTLQYVWRKFVTEWRTNGCQKLYYLRMDIRDAYPSVSMSRLRDIIKSTLEGVKPKVTLKKFIVIGSGGKKTIKETIFDGQSRSSWYTGIHVRPCIAMDMRNDAEIQVSVMMDKINTILDATNIIRMGKHLYKFDYGLPQAWSQSPLLCNIYYGHADAKSYIPYLKSNGRLFIRLVDDYLFVTPAPEEILELTKLMKVGCDKIGVQLNEDKSASNIYVRSDVEISASSCETVTFCGWNFCITCGHVSRDFGKYSGQDFCSTISFQMTEKTVSPEDFLRLRGTTIVPARVKPILLDPAINCYKRILLSVFEASISLSYRFYAMCRVLYPNLNDSFNSETSLERVEVAVSCILICCFRLARYVARNAEYRGPIFSSQEKASCDTISNCCGSQSQNLMLLPIESASSSSNSSSSHSNESNILGVDSLKYTALYGFRMKLLKHSGVFQKVLPHINRCLKNLETTIGVNCCDTIKEIVGCTMPQWATEILK